MPKVLAQAGISLADVYDVEGSIAGIDFIDTDRVALVHEMGGEIFSERLTSQILTISTGTIAQNSTFSAVFSTIPDSPTRILGVQVIADAASAARVQLASVSLLGPGTDGEIPIFVFDSTDDNEGLVRLSLQGAAVATFPHFSPRLQHLPTLITRHGDSEDMLDIALRGITLGFGAGTVVITALVHIARAGRATPVPGDPRSHGLPLPSW